MICFIIFVELNYFYESKIDMVDFVLMILIDNNYMEELGNMEVVYYYVNLFVDNVENRL